MDRRREFTDQRVGDFIRRYHAGVREDPLLGPLYACVKDWPGHSAKLADYWAHALRQETTPNFPTLPQVRFGMDPERLERWIEVWNAAAAEVFTGHALEEVLRNGQEIAEEHMICALPGDGA